jgi:hypothetical protein
MSKKTLIPEEKWEGLRHAMEEAAGTRKMSKTPRLPPAAEDGAAQPERGKKDKDKDKDKNKDKNKDKKKKKKEKKEKKEKKKKEKKEKRKKNGKKGKG